MAAVSVGFEFTSMGCLLPGLFLLVSWPGGPLTTEFPAWVMICLALSALWFSCLLRSVMGGSTMVEPEISCCSFWMDWLLMLAPTIKFSSEDPFLTSFSELTRLA